jgi:flagellar hook-associated protein 3 FlgL
MRVADANRFEAYKQSLSTMKSRLDKLQQMIVSGKKIVSPSDDPQLAGTVVSMGIERESLSQYKNVTDKLGIYGNFYNSSLMGAADLLTRAKELAVTYASSNTPSSTRAAAAEEVKGIIDRLASLGNTKVGNVYIFGGKNADVPAYTVNADYSVTFNGTDDVNSVLVGKGQKMDAGISGNAVLKDSSGDVFAELKKLKDALELDDTQGLKNAVDGIESAVDTVTKGLARVGSFGSRVEGVASVTEERDLALTQAESDTLYADVAGLITDFNTLSTSYEMLLYSMSKIQNISLLNYI